MGGYVRGVVAAAQAEEAWAESSGYRFTSLPSTIGLGNAKKYRHVSNVRNLTLTLAEDALRRDHRCMVSPVVIGGFAVLDGAILGQLAYAVTQYHKNHDQG